MTTYAIIVTDVCTFGPPAYLCWRILHWLRRW